MALTQMQLIQSLGEALAWLQREIEWEVPPTELRHLCGRIGELYVAMITNGRMATGVNQPGYDVMSSDGKRISVKTTAQSGWDGNVNFNTNTLALVDHVFVLRINIEEMQVEVLLDKPVEEVRGLLSGGETGKSVLPLRRLMNRPPPTSTASVHEVEFKGYVVRELETGTIEVLHNGSPRSPVKPALREIAVMLNLSLVNAAGIQFTTRQLGTQIIKCLQTLQGRSSIDSIHVTGESGRE